VTFQSRQPTKGSKLHCRATFHITATKPTIANAQYMSGRHLAPAPADLEAYGRFQIEHLGCSKGLLNIKPDIPMQEIKHSWEIPV
jgi:hypothetical protein